MITIIWTEHIFSTSLNFILENFYYLAGIALFLVGISQVKSAITIAKTRTERDAITITAQQCEKFYKELVPLANELHEEFQKIGFNIEYSKKISMSKSDLGKYSELVLGNRDLLDKHLYLTNLLDSFATYFVEGVGNSEKAYKILGKTFCTVAETTTPVILIGAKDRRFTSLTELYKTWTIKIENEEAESAYIKAKNNDKEHFKVFGL